ncbi:MAG: T9SS type A sorting domain-containing protein [bacterium]|nr:T9SS type A sorting domain-containing protein [bacterium]
MSGFRLRFLAHLSLALLFLLPFSVAEAADITYADSWGAQGLTIQEDRSSGLTLVYSLEQWQLSQSDITGDLLHNVAIQDALLPNDAGAPDLPGQSYFIALPNGATAHMEIVDFRTELFRDIDLTPAFRLPREDEDGPLDYTRNMSIYTTDAPYPAAPVLLDGRSTIRGVEAIMLGITPFQYNPVSRELTVYRDIRISVTFEGGDGTFGDSRLNSRWWDPILRSTFINSTELPAVEQVTDAGARTPDYEYLIISPEDATFLAWADSIRVFRTEQGIRSGIVTISELGGNTSANIENYVNDAYLNWDLPPSAVLILGDYGTGALNITSPVYSNGSDACVSDNKYADVDGDHMPEMAFARICAADDAQVAHMVTKALEYERHPPTNPDFYANPVIAGGWQTVRWFILCNEVIYGFLNNELGMTPVREYAIYEGTPGTLWSEADNTSVVVNYFGPNGLGYLPATPEHLNDWGGNAARLNADINAGAFMVQHRDHGGETGWGEPDYTNPDLAGLTNDDLTFVFSINCLTGKYDGASECFAEAFHRHQQGALGLIAASELSYSFVNDTYVWGMYDYFWPDFNPGYGVPGEHKLLPAFGNAYGKIFLQGSSWPYNTWDKEVTYNLFHHHGDAFTSVYSAVPQSLTVIHDAALLTGTQEFTVTADTGALIGISRDGEYLGSAVSQGFPVEIAIPSQTPGGNVTITVTKQNHYRYSQEIPVVPPEGPYLVYSDIAVIDPEGDNDGILDGAETVGLELVLKNVGIEITTGISATLTCDDPYITIIEGTRSFPDIPADGLGTCLETFDITVAGSVPDGHLILFNFVAISDDGNWSDSFVLAAQAPILIADGMSINDSVPQGGNGSGTADAGDTFILDLGLGNIGHSAAASLNGTLSCLDFRVTILQNQGNCPNVPIGGQATMEDFQVHIDPDFPEPDIVKLNLLLTGPGGFTKLLIYNVAVGGWFDDYGNDNGWTVASTAASGHWERADPVGTTYETSQVQPEDDHTADPEVFCFVTGNGVVGGTAGANDIDGGETVLYSPVFHLQGAGTATITYWRWYSNDLGNNPGEDSWIVQATSNGSNWVDLENTTTSANYWQQFTFDLADYILMSDQVQIRFIAADADNASLVEAAVDDFLLDATFPILTGITDETTLPAHLSLSGNYPNPFNPTTSICFALPGKAPVDLAVFDVKGRRVATLVQGTLAAGEHEVVWHGRDSNGRPVATGLYFSRLVCGDQTLTRKMLLLK